MQVFSTFKYGEFEGSFDSSDYKEVEKLEKARKVFIDKYDNLLKKFNEGNMKGSAFIKSAILAIANFFDNVFEDGASNAILGGSTSLALASDALAKFGEYQATAGEELVKSAKDSMDSRQGVQSRIHAMTDAINEKKAKLGVLK